LQRSALHWDEIIYFPLASLTPLLVLADAENKEKAFKEIAFIVAQRPSQIQVARQAMLQIVLSEMEERGSIRDISSASYRLEEILPEDSNIIDPAWRTTLSRFNEASKEASRYLNARSSQAKRESLEEFEKSLEQIQKQATFSNSQFGQQSVQVIEKWLETAQQERARLQEELQENVHLSNPYSPGELQNKLFVGRHDIAELIEKALRNTNSHPTFLLYGERRMGKTSALKQMANLLGKRYLVVYVDLQSPSYRAGAAEFVGNLAEQIYDILSRNGLLVKPFGTTKLKEVAAKSELAVYATFDTWLKPIEQTLEDADRTLLITFDEFEKLEESDTQAAMNLTTLLDWLRNVIQQRPRLALLFSGVKLFSEMGSGWSGYFVNVQNVKVSFLKPEEARLLITQPLPDFQGDQIYPSAVVDEIIRVTGCQPLLVQAICSELIKQLSATERQQAVLEDVPNAVEATLESWGSYFDDLWRRTTPNERTCLEMLVEREVLPSELAEIATLTSLEISIVRAALQRLLRRDIVTETKGEGFRLAIPMLRNWIKQYSERIV
jgi:AAA+ ATPase superfamily predicted ATPase